MILGNGLRQLETTRQRTGICIIYICIYIIVMLRIEVRHVSIPHHAAERIFAANARTMMTKSAPSRLTDENVRLYTGVPKIIFTTTKII